MTIKQKVTNKIGKGFTFGSDRYVIESYNDSRYYPVVARRTNRKPHSTGKFTLEASRIKR